MCRILIIEDDEDINRLLYRMLKSEGYEVIRAYSGTEGRLLLEKDLPDLILTDLMLPGMSGEDVAKYVRTQLKSSVPIIVISAKSALEDKVELITSGADDYITKPFEPEEVRVRVMAALRRNSIGRNSIGGNSNLTYKRLMLNPDSREVTVCGEMVSLTPHEYEILYIMLQQPEKVYTRDMLYEMVWHNGYLGEDNTINVHISNIRKKIAAADGEDEYIKTVWGIGFKMS